MNIECTQFFRLLSDETRLRCLSLMKHHGELCVCELVYTLGISQPKVSRHLASLRDAGIVIDKRQGQWIYYRINPKLDSWARQVINKTANETAAQTPYCNDLDRLENMPDRPGSACCA